MDWTSVGPSVLASFMASMVEFVEALTIVLAVGAVRGWRPALLGTGGALAVLGILVLTLGQSLSRVPLGAVQLVVGTLLLLFGLRWLRKAVLRAAGVLALHDEAQAFAHETEVLRKAGAALAGAFDKVAFTTAFKIVMVEGIEVVFIVIALGANGRLIVPATAGALLALVAVIALGLCLHKPLANVPENSLKFGVGVMLCAFGSFWVGERIGLEWPGADWALLGLIAAYLVVALGLVALCRRLKGPAGRRTKSQTVPLPRSALLRLWNELVGLFFDDGLLAVGALVWTTAAWGLEAAHAVQMGLACFLFAVGLAAVLCASAVRRAMEQAA
jgi:uncharacterized membrane protein